MAYDLITNLFRNTTRGATPGHNNFLSEIGLTIIGLVSYLWYSLHHFCVLTMYTLVRNSRVQVLC